MPRERPAGPHLDLGLERALPRWRGVPSFHARTLPPPTLSRTHSRLADEGSNDGLKPTPSFGLFAFCTAEGCALATAPNAGPGFRWAPPIGGPPPDRALSRTHSRLADEGSNDELKPAPSFGLFAPCTAEGCALATAPNAGPRFQWAPPNGGPPPPDRALCPRICSRSSALGGPFHPRPSYMSHTEATPSKLHVGGGSVALHVALAPVGSARTRHPVRVHGMRDRHV